MSAVLTRRECDVLAAAAAALLAGENDMTANAARALADALVKLRGKHVGLLMTLAEAKGLRACADEGAAGLLNDRTAGAAYIGHGNSIAAARRALDSLGIAAVG